MIAPIMLDSVGSPPSKCVAQIPIKPIHRASDGPPCELLTLKLVWFIDELLRIAGALQIRPDWAAALTNLKFEAEARFSAVAMILRT